ncbi:ribonuclease H-like domain-containing protein [Tanacetum coccineum]
MRASTDAAIRNQGALIKTLEIQIGQMSKVLQERGNRGLPGSTKPNPMDHVRSISTTKADSSEIRRMGCSSYAVSDSQHRSTFFETVPFPRRLQNYYCDDWRETQDVKILEAYDHTLPQKEKDQLTIEMADRTIKQPRGIAENVLVRIDKFIFPIDFIILDIPEDDDVPLILGRPFLSTAHSKIDVYKRKFTLRAGEEKLVFKSIKPATSLTRRVFMLKNLETKLIGEDNESFDPLYGNYIELNDLDMPLEPETIQDVNFKPTFINKPEISSKCYYKIKFSCTTGYKNVNADFIPSLFVNLITKSFYYSIIKDKDDHEGNSPAGTLIDIPIFVGKFSILTGFIIVDNNDVTSDVALGMPFFTR